MQEIKIGKYRHYKGKEYEVIGLARDSETLGRLVIYKALYNSEGFGKNATWVRPVESFLEEVILNNKKIKRFEFIE